MKYEFFSWEKITTRAMILATMVRFSKKQPDLIVAIARGGLSIAHILSDLLKLPVASFTVSSYHDLKRTDDLRISFKVGGRLNGKSVLLVDDVSDSGKTFIRAIAYLKRVGAREVIPISLFVKPETEFVPEHFAERTDAWIIFPWDQFETMKILYRKWSFDGMAEESIRCRFLEFGFLPNVITYFFSMTLLPPP